jgi:hypothetical protein
MASSPPMTPAGLDDNAEGLAQLLKLLAEHGDSLRAGAGAGPSTPSTLRPSPDTSVAMP